MKVPHVRTPGGFLRSGRLVTDLEVAWKVGLSTTMKDGA